MATNKYAGKESGFAAQLATFAVKSTDQASSIMRESIARFGARVITGTPVDEGTARGSWNAQEGSPDMSFTGEKDPTGANAIARLSVALEGVEVGSKFFLSSSAPHIVPLEYGHSEQAPGGMARIAAAEWPQMVAAAAAKQK